MTPLELIKPYTHIISNETLIEYRKNDHCVVTYMLEINSHQRFAGYFFIKTEGIKELVIYAFKAINERSVFVGRVIPEFGKGFEYWKLNLEIEFKISKAKVVNKEEWNNYLAKKMLEEL